MGALTEQERETFDALVSGEYANLALVRSNLDGRDVAVIAAVGTDDGEYIISPLAVLVDDALMAQLADPAELMDEEER